jgi:hypothetical protein
MTEFEFMTASTLYRVTPVGFGLIRVDRSPRDPYTPPECVSLGVRHLMVDDLTVHPAHEGGSILEARRVALWRDGKPILLTSGGDSSACAHLEWREECVEVLF